MPIDLCIYIYIYQYMYKFWVICEVRYMTDEQKTFLSILMCSLSSTHAVCGNVYHINEAIENLAYTHQCIPLLYQGCVNSNTSCPDFWKKKAMYCPINNARKLIVQKKVCDIFSKAEIPFAVFKGSAVAILYPNPDIRDLGDIDLIVSESDYERAILRFKDEITEEEAWHKFHFGIKVDGVDVEIHKHITYKTDDEAGKVLVEVMDGALDEIIWCKYDSFEFPMLKNKYHALALLHHKLRHFHKNNFVMRNLCDWAYFVKSVEQKEWDEEVYPLIQKVSLDKFADAFTLCADKYLGFENCSKIGNDIDEDVVDNLMGVLISCGLSKDKNNFSANIGSIYSKYIMDHNKCVSFIKTINDISKKKYKFASKPYLLPLAWACMLSSHIFSKKGKGKKLNIKKVNKLAEKRSKLYIDLNIMKND